MGYRTWEVVLGAAVMVVAVAFVAFALRSTGTTWTQGGTYPLHATFRSAEGVRMGTDVRLAGVKIGSVGGLSLDPQSFRAQVTVNIDPAIELPRDSSIQVASEGLLGGTFIEILPGGDFDNLAAGESFQDTQSAVSLVTLLLRFVTGSSSEEAVQ
ncbi:outer membrane lipid asymmetry maintenance protein MlaD [Pararhodobacter oceanensis]|uniref:Outer membrane lipid asymmetry maintenance protein MlaD n=1 Tax=Pararhodobacter oceanensis TaxID=2172121 RepID=A0A2T8HTA7_9RHOB|nr:outer membrane lipid asymmetry maintenance protein MlaD [Pararhodobacter oceanensis]PVH28633.1 outer membrane lipid asymmetry maintenance protein MlaD [Pararhodobacter oceanensis]